MPDLITHLGATYALARNGRRWDVRWFLLGAILPDLVTMSPYVLMDLVPALGRLDPDFAHLCVHMYHTPFMCALLAGLIALCTTRFAFVFGAVTSGAVLHLFMDLFQKTADGGVFFYPLRIRSTAIGLFWYGEWWTEPLALLLLALVLWLWRRDRGRIPAVGFQFRANRKLRLIPLFLVPLLALPLLTRQAAYHSNVNARRFLHEPAAFEGKPVGLSVSEVVAVNARDYVLRESGLTARVARVTGLALEAGDWVSVKGVYHAPAIVPHTVYKHKYTTKVMLSGAGLLLLGLLWFTCPRRD